MTTDNTAPQGNPSVSGYRLEIHTIVTLRGGLLQAEVQPVTFDFPSDELCRAGFHAARAMLNAIQDVADTAPTT